MTIRTRTAIAGVLGVLLGIAALVAVTSRPAAAAGQAASSLALRGTTSMAVSGTSSTVDATGIETSQAALGTDENVPNSGNGAARVAAAGVPTPAANALAAPGSELLGSWSGLNHRAERFAGTGAYANTNFSLEPPDQALCAGGGYVVESVNDAIRVFGTDGSAPGPAVALNQFFQLAPAINRKTHVFGDFTSDPKCLYDSGHFILTILQAGQVSTNGHFDGTGHVEIAVSQTGDPSGAWTLYEIDTASDGGDCPCLGDQPLIGVDANGFYVSTNSFPFFHDGFNGAQLYAMSKSQLESGGATTVVRVPVTAPAGFDGIPYSLQPAKAAPGSPDAAGTEYFLSALDFNSTLDNRIAVWKLRGTGTLGSSTPNVTLSASVVSSEVYGQPPAAEQSPDGSFPLRDGVFGPVQALLFGFVWDNGTYHTELLNSNDDRMNEVVYSGGKLFGAVNTVVKTPNGPTHTGIAWFVVNAASPSVVNQGYLTANQENLMYPAFGVNSAGKGAIGVSIVGADMHPSTAYAMFDGSSFGPLHISYTGLTPDDGFTGYEATLPPGSPTPLKAGTQKGVARWGDYGATAVDSDGSIWLANETTTPTLGTRSALANWGTFISHVRP